MRLHSQTPREGFRHPNPMVMGTLRAMNLRAATFSVIAAVCLAGCASTDTDTGTDRFESPASSPSPSEQSQLYATALRHLVLVDSPFATAPTRMGSVYIVDGPASRSAQMVTVADGSPFAAELKNEITAQSDDLPPVEFTADPQQYAEPTRQGVTGVAHDGVIVALSPTWWQDDGTVHIGVGLWCGIDCGLGLTYVLDRIDERWTVTGTTGPVSIS